MNDKATAPTIEPKNIQDKTHCRPHEPRPHHEHHDHHKCHGTIELDCHCPILKTKTFVLNVGPQTEATLLTFEGNTFAAWENAGYNIMAHSITDTGSGWLFVFTVGWYI